MLYYYHKINKNSRNKKIIYDLTIAYLFVNNIFSLFLCNNNFLNTMHTMKREIKVHAIVPFPDNSRFKQLFKAQNRRVWFRVKNNDLSCGFHNDEILHSQNQASWKLSCWNARNSASRPILQKNQFCKTSRRLLYKRGSL